VGHQDGVRRVLVRRAVLTPHIAHLLVAVAAQPEERRQGARAGHADEAGFADAHAVEEGDERGGLEKTAGDGAGHRRAVLKRGATASASCLSHGRA
jgi:hypothetical protein